MSVVAKRGTPSSNSPMVPRVRPAIDGDSAQVAACVRTAFEPYAVRMGRLPAPMLANFQAAIAAGHVWVAETDAGIAGALVQFGTEHGFFIDTVAVLPACQGTGVGRALLVFAEHEARRRGFASIYLYTNAKMTENQVFYPSIGYVEYDRKFDAGYDRVFYRKSLA